ncbi:PC3-like endoprotease variant B [Aplysia californica]|uniref:PC3-like endoprotease variant B n=1 Tax=Aplysia californica TaxID=6500 RepID=A0ABM0K287_APLCA|nr:PC3-like endoprotease variant B [Aplysia californica]
MFKGQLQVSWPLCLFALLCIGNFVSTRAAENYGHYLNQFAIRLKSGNLETAQKIAREHGLIVKRELPNINIFLLEHPKVHYRAKRSAENELKFLQNDERVAHAQQEVVLHRVKRRNVIYDKQLELPIRSIEDDSLYTRVEPSNLATRDNIYGVSVKFEDPKFKDMWYLVNRGQSGGEKGLDMNVAVVWQNGFTGKGVVVCILDDGIDHTHPDLSENYDPEASTDLNDKRDPLEDPMPDTSNIDNSHGTHCAGEVAAAANNDVCGVGVAYNAKIGGVRILDGPVTDALEAEALTFNNKYIDIYSSSWGPNDDGATMEGPRLLALEALRKGVTEGRAGLGSIFVWATGNGGMNEDDCSADGYVSRPETLSVGSVNDWGRSPFFMENCSSTLAVVPSGGEDYIDQERETGVKLKVVTTDMNGGCIENFQGTSSAAPLAAGCLANVLQANPLLSWRDVQHLVVRGSRIPSADSSWTINGAGHHVSHRFGFGLFDCGKMVELAQSWENFPQQRVCNTTRKNYQILKSGGKIVDSMEINGCYGHESQSIDRLEHVQVHVKMSTVIRGDTEIVLTSPAGTRSVLLSPRGNDNHHGEWEFTFMTVHSWDESPKGTWTLTVHHRPGSVKPRKNTDEENFKDDLHKLTEMLDMDTSPPGYIKEWSLVLYGTHGTRHQRAHLEASREQNAFSPSEKVVLEIKKKEVELSKRVQVKRAEISGLKNSEMEKVDDKTERDELIRTLWNTLHRHGGKYVKKRVLKTSIGTGKFVKKKNLDNIEDLDKLVDYVTSMLENAIQERGEK